MWRKPYYYEQIVSMNILFKFVERKNLIKAARPKITRKLVLSIDGYYWVQLVLTGTDKSDSILFCYCFLNLILWVLVPNEEFVPNSFT